VPGEHALEAGARHGLTPMGPKPGEWGHPSSMKAIVSPLMRETLGLASGQAGDDEGEEVARRQDADGAAGADDGQVSETARAEGLDNRRAERARTSHSTINCPGCTASPSCANSLATLPRNTKHGEG